MKPSKRIWELQSSTVCKVVGMALHLKDLQKIGRKFNISNDDPLMDEEFVLHTTVVQMCARDNLVSRHTEKLIEKRFVVYAQKVSYDNPIQLIQSLRESVEGLLVPLWAILWGLATRGRLTDSRIETSLFGFIHMMEHRLLRDHWKNMLSEGDENSQIINKDGEILALKRNLLDMQQANKKLEKLADNLRNQLYLAASVKPEPVDVPTPDHSRPKQCRCPNVQKVRNLKVLLDQAKYCNYELEAENSQLRDEIDGLVQELRLSENRSINSEASMGDSCPYVHALRGKKVTLVGGIESLECHYRQLIESLGGQFRRHDGACNGGTQALEDSIVGSDLVVCPVEVNSHNAAKSVKRICKSSGVRCCFPRSASITGLRKALHEHYSDQQVA